MNTRNKGERPRRRMLAAIVLSLIFNITFANAEELHTTDVQNEVPPVYVEQHMEHVKETERCKQREAEKKRQEKKRLAKIKKEQQQWESIGDCRITTYCPACNDPAGTYQSSSGATLYEGVVACNWLSNGTKIKIEGWGVYTVMDTCGTDAIDVFVDTDGCYCNTNCYAKVYIWKG